MTRKSPHKHRVKTHKRKNRRVRSYSRGKGKRRSNVIVKRRIISNEEMMVRAQKDIETRYPEGFEVKLFYSSKKHPFEVVNVVARDLDFPADDPIDEALSEALKKRKYGYKVQQVIVTDPALGKIVARITGGLRSGVGRIKSGVSRVGTRVKAGIKKVAPRIKHVTKAAVTGAKGVAGTAVTIPGAPGGGGVVYQEPSAIMSVPTTRIVRESRQLQASEVVEIRNLTTDAFERPGLPLKYKALAEAKLATEYPEAYQAIKRRYSEEGR